MELERDRCNYLSSQFVFFATLLDTIWVAICSLLRVVCEPGFLHALYWSQDAQLHGLYTERDVP